MTGQSFPTNILILGKTGVGKSSLLNYLFGSEVAATGTGRPVTEQGIFSYSPFRFGDMEIVIHDSWGLEPDKADQWRKIIEDEVRKNNTKEIRDWFHSIIYCVDCKRARIEDFEQEEILRPLVESGNRLIFALTKADIASEEERAATAGVLKERWPSFPQLEICSIHQKLRTGRTTEAFGREELFKEICRNLRKNLLCKTFDLFQQQCSALFNKAFRLTLGDFDKKAGRFGIFTSYGDDFRSYINEKFTLLLRVDLLEEMNILRDNLATVSSIEAISLLNLEKINLEKVKILSEIDMSPLDLENYDHWKNNLKENLTAVIGYVALPTTIFFKKARMKKSLNKFCQDSITLLEEKLDKNIARLKEEICKESGMTMQDIVTQLPQLMS